MPGHRASSQLGDGAQTGCYWAKDAPPGCSACGQLLTPLPLAAGTVWALSIILPRWSLAFGQLLHPTLPLADGVRHPSSHTQPAPGWLDTIHYLGCAPHLWRRAEFEQRLLGPTAGVSSRQQVLLLLDFSCVSVWPRTCSAGDLLTRA